MTRTRIVLALCLAVAAALVACDSPIDGWVVTEYGNGGTQRCLYARSSAVECDPPVTTTTTSTTTSTSTTTTTTPPDEPALWHADADNDHDYGADTNCMDKHLQGTGSSLTIAADPLGLHGQVYRASIVGANRAEWDKAFVNCTHEEDGRLNLWGTDSANVQPLYIGWRSLFTGNYDIKLGSNNGGNVVQFKGDSSCGGPAVGMTLRYGRLSLRTLDGADPNDPNWKGVDGLWNDPVLFSQRMGAWHSFVALVNFAKDDSGFIELWVDGDHQLMDNGTFRFHGPTVCPDDSRVYPKMGVYDTSSSSAPVHWTEDPRIGTTYEAVAP